MHQNESMLLIPFLMKFLKAPHVNSTAYWVLGSQMGSYFALARSLPSSSSSLSPKWDLSSYFFLLLSSAFTDNWISGIIVRNG